MMASSIPHCCSGLTLPTSSPSRPASTAPICSTSTRVVSPSRSISGRNDAGRALREVGATRTTERGRSSLAWTITPYRRPSCSWLPRGRRNSWTSPPGLEEADMKQRLAITAIALIVTSLLCACATGRPASRVASSVMSPAAVTSTGPRTVVGYVQGFYRSYIAARKVGQRAAEAVVRSHVAAWYFPILEAPNMAGADPVECGLPGPVADWSFMQADVLGGQAVIVIGSQPPGASQE